MQHADTMCYQPTTVALHGGWVVYKATLHSANQVIVIFQTKSGTDFRKLVYECKEPLLYNLYTVFDKCCITLKLGSEE
jgi:hypothetical protein